MKIEPAVRRATLLITAGVLICSAVMQVIYLIITLASPLTWHYSFLLGNLLMSAASVLNFFLMSYNMQRVIASGNTDGVRRRIQFNHMLRSLMMAGVLVIAFLFRQHFHIVATIISVGFPQLTMLFSHFFTRKKQPDAQSPIEAAFTEAPVDEDPLIDTPTLDTGGEEDNEQG